MRPPVLYISIFLIVGLSCSKENNSICEGTITGKDMSLCMCCGGWFIEIDNATYRFNKLPENCNIHLENEILPISVKLDWQKDKNQCLGDEIIIKRIVKN